MPVERMIINKRIPDVNGRKLSFTKIEEAHVHAFATEATEAEVDLSMTRRIRERDWAHVGIVLTKPCYVEELEDVTTETYKKVVERLGLELSTIQDDLEKGLPNTATITVAEEPTITEAGDHTVEVRRGDRTIRVHIFQTAVARVDVAIRTTLELPGMESAHAGFRFSVPCYAEEMDHYLNWVLKFVKGLIRGEASKVYTYREKKAKEAATPPAGWGPPRDALTGTPAGIPPEPMQPRVKPTAFPTGPSMPVTQPLQSIPVIPPPPIGGPMA